MTRRGAILMTGIVLMLLAPVTASQAASGDTTRVSVTSSGAEASDPSYFPSLSSDGRYVAFEAYGPLIPADTNNTQDVYVLDRSTNALSVASVSSTGVQGDASSYEPSISANGRYVAFYSLATTFASNDYGIEDVFVHDMVTGKTIFVSQSSMGKPGIGYSAYPSISADGRYVAFYSEAANLVPGDRNNAGDVFVRDLVANKTIRASVGIGNVSANGQSFAPVISANGRFVVFGSNASNLVRGDTNGVSDVFVRDLVKGTTQRVSVSSSGIQGDDNSGFQSLFQSISADGRYVAFDSNATNLVANDTNGAMDVFVYDRTTKTTARVSVDGSGNEADNWSLDPRISGDGSRVAFTSGADNLIASDTNSTGDIFVKDLSTGDVTRASVASDGTEANDSNFYPAISSSGTVVGWVSFATNLVAGDNNGVEDVFVHEM